MKQRLFLLLWAIIVIADGMAQGPNNSGTYYANADGKKGAELKTALCAIIRNSFSRTGGKKTIYDALWTDFQTTDKKANGKVWDMYSVKREFIFVTDQAGNYSKEGDVYNREHSFPKSWFNEATPMYYDLYHLYPTDGYVNGRRGNLPLGENNGGTYKSYDGFSKVGSCTYSGSGAVSCFEPNDIYKGDLARTYFYMVTCYENELPSWVSYEAYNVTLDGNKYPGLTSWQLSMLMEWAANDPVSDKEINRNNAVYSIQHNRNPFIDYPGLERYIWGDLKTTSFSYDGTNSGTGSNENSYTLSIKTTGNGYVTYENNTIRSKTSTFAVNEGISAKVTFVPDAGYRLKSVKLNNADVTSSVSNNQYTISNIRSNTTIEVEFEAISTTREITIGASGFATFCESVGFDFSNTNIKAYTCKVVNGKALLSEIKDGIVPAYNGVVLYREAEGTENIPIVDANFSLSNNELVGVTTKTTVDWNSDGYYNFILQMSEGHVKFFKATGATLIANKAYLHTLSEVSAYTTLEVVFEEIPPTTYSLNISVSGNGSVTYGDVNLKNQTQTFTVNEGTNAALMINPESGYRIGSVKVNNVDVTAQVVNSRYTISNIKSSTTVEVTFEAIPVTTYSLSIIATGHGAVIYNGTSVRDNTTTFTVNEGTSPQITLSADEGYRVASVKLNNVDVTANVYNNRYTINNISGNVAYEVVFEEIPPTTYSLNISVSGNGSVTYGDVNLKNQTQTFTVNEGTNAALMINPESGFRIGSVKVNNVDVTAQVVNSRYTISNIKSSTTVEVTFEAIPITTYQLSVIAKGNGSVMYDGSAVRGQTMVFSVNEGTNVSLSFSPDNGNSVGSVKVNGVDVTSQAAGNHYTISSMSANTTVEVTFMVDVNALTVDGVNYKVTSQVNKTITVTGGSYGQVLTVPASVTQNGVTWMVAGIEKDALSGITDLSAIIWNPTTKFTAEVSNPNLLLYVQAEEYASSCIRNIVVNGTAPSITLTEAVSGNNFYCPQAFVAQHISYTHYYGMTTGVKEARGWETIALPFDVQTISHAEKGAMIPFAGWSSAKTDKPFWLYEMTGNGFVKASEIKAYTPYIISMPNNAQYTDEWLLNGSVTFEAHGVYIDTSENLHKAQFKDRTFVPCFSTKSSIEGLYALNVNNDYSQNNTGMPEGSRFVLNMRPIHPFEAFMTTENNARAFIPIFEDGLPTDISLLLMNKDSNPSKLYNLNGQQVEHPKKGVYIVNGKKVVVK